MKDCSLPKLLGVNELAELLGISPKTVYNLAQQRKIPFVRISNRLRFDPADVLQWVRKNRVPSLEE